MAIAIATVKVMAVLENERGECICSRLLYMAIQNSILAIEKSVKKRNLLERVSLKKKPPIE